MNPIAPPEQMAEQGPVAPPNVNNAAPVGEAPTPVVAQNTDIHSMYEDAATNGDPVSMYALSSRLKDTPEGNAIKKAAVGMQERIASVENDAKPIFKAGGINSPEGRIEASNTFKTIADKPEKMRAIAEMLMGNKDWRKFVTGGTPTTSIGYDKNGDQLERTHNELGQTISVIDSRTGLPLDRQQLAERGGFLTSLDNAIGFQQQKDIGKFNAAAFGKANEVTNNFQAKAPVQKELYSELRQRLQGLAGSELTDKQRQAIGSFTNRSMGYSQTLSQGFNALQQKVDNKNANLSRAEQTALGAVMEKLNMKIDASGSVTKKNGEAVTKTELGQAQDTLNNGNQFERNFSQSKEDFINNKVFSNLGVKEKESLGRVLDLQGVIERNNLELNKNGSLPFLINPKAYEIGNEFSRGEAMALIGEFNQDAIEAYGKWRAQQLQSYKRTGQVPNAGELESAFSRTPEFKDLKREYANKNHDILSRTIPAREEVPSTAEGWSLDLGLKPEVEKPEGVKGRSMKNSSPVQSSQKPVLIGKTPNGKNVYRTSDGKQVVEQ
jgi:hypothetical protein